MSGSGGLCRAARPARLGLAGLGPRARPRDALSARRPLAARRLTPRRRPRRRGAEAGALGRGGSRRVAGPAGVREARVSLGVDELESGREPLGGARRQGGGRRPLADTDRGLVPALLALVGGDERGDPMIPLRW